MSKQEIHPETEQAVKTETEMIVEQAINLLSPLTHLQRDVVLKVLIEEREHWFDRPYVAWALEKNCHNCF